MDLSRDHLRAAAACGCAFLPATDEQVRRLAVQRRIFRVGGEPVVATRGGGFYETWGTLAALIEKGMRRGPQDAVAMGAAAAEARAMPSAAGSPAAAPAEPMAPPPEQDSGVPAAQRRKPTAPRPKAPPPAPIGATATRAPQAAAPSQALEMLDAVGAAQGRGPTARIIGRRRRAGQPPPPRWTIAGKMRRGRLK